MPEADSKNHHHTAGIEHATLAILALGLLATSGIFFHAMAGIPVTIPVPGFSSEPERSLASLSSEVTNNTSSLKPKSKPLAKNESPLILPTHVLLEVPFTAQAPYGNWDPPWDETCEEASVLMAMDWVFSTNVASAPDSAAKAIQNIIAFEDQNFGYHNDTKIRETAKIISRFYAYSGIDVVYDITLTDVRHELASGNLVILPLAGALLENPNFSTPPPYHMVVAVGYDDTAGELIVQEPGTKHGRNYRYSYDTIERAIHDWTGDNETMAAGQRGMIVVHPNTAE